MIYYDIRLSKSERSQMISMISASAHSVVKLLDNTEEQEKLGVTKEDLENIMNTYENVQVKLLSAEEQNSKMIKQKKSNIIY